MTQDQTLRNVAPLANVVRLNTLIERCDARASGLPGMGCFYGPAGRGKSFGGIFMANRFHACHVQALPFGGAKKLFQMIVTELGLRPRNTVADLFDQAIGQLAKTGRTLIIDEADLILKDSIIESIRLLHDHAAVPVIFMGEELLPQKLKRWERVNSRIMSWVAAEDATAEDLNHLARIYARDIALDDALKAELLERSGGSIRHVSTNLAAVAELAATKGLTRVTMTDWGQRHWNSEQPPEPRVVRFRGEVTRRRGAA